MNDLAVKNQGLYEGSNTAPNSRDKTNASNNATDAFKMLVSNMKSNTATSVAALGSKASFMGIADNNDELSPSNSYDREPHDNDTDDYISQDHNSYDDDARPEHRSDENLSNNSNSPDVRQDDPQTQANDQPEKDNSPIKEASHNDDTPAQTSEAQDGTSGDETTSQTTDQSETVQSTDTSADPTVVAVAAAVSGNTNAMEALATAGANAQSGTAGEAGKTRAENIVANNKDSGTSNGKAGLLQEAIVSPGATGTKGKATNQVSQNTQQGLNLADTNSNSNKPGELLTSRAQDTSKANTAQQQAADLAKALGNGTNTKVSVEITDETKSVTSKASSMLSNGATASDGKNGSAQNTQGLINAQNALQNAAAQSQATQVHIQAQIQQSAAQTQGTNTPSTASNATGQGGPSGVTTASEGSGSIAGTTQQTPQTQQSNAAARSQIANMQRTAAADQSATEQVTIKIIKGMAAGNDKIKLQLHPSELGKVEVKMELTSDGRAMAVVTADNRDTLETLRRDAGDLQRALADAGIDLSSDDMEFNLNEQQEQLADDNNGQQNTLGNDPEDDELSEVVSEVMEAHELGVLGNGRVDFKA